LSNQRDATAIITHYLSPSTPTPGTFPLAHAHSWLQAGADHPFRPPHLSVLVCCVHRSWKPWIPPKLSQGLQQGGVYVFEGERCLFEHKDAVSEDGGDDADDEAMLIDVAQKFLGCTLSLDIGRIWDIPILPMCRYLDMYLDII